MNMQQDKQLVNLADMESMLSMLKASADPTRLRLLALAAEGMYTVSELTGILGQSQPRVSRHLKLLCDAGLIERIPEGAWVFYRAAQQGVAKDFTRQVIALSDPDDTDFVRDSVRLEQVRQKRRDSAGEYFRQNAADWGRIRSHYVEEARVEEAILGLLQQDGFGQLVDLGTGTGRMLVLLAGRVDAGIGIDMSRDMLSLARAALDAADAGHCHVRQGDIYTTPIDDESCDLVTMHQVLHYADAPEEVFAEINRILRPGGKALIVDFAPHDVESLRKEHQHRRLGFDSPEIAEWGQQVAGDNMLSMQKVISLPGEPITVNLWLLEKTAKPQTS